MKVVSSEGMALIDRRTQAEFAIPGAILMDEAGVKAWAALGRLAPDGRPPRGRLVFVAGKGSNGGDASVMARQAAVGRRRPDGCAIVLAGGRPSGGTDAEGMLAMAESLGVACVDAAAEPGRAAALIHAADWVFDGIAGTGLTGSLREPLASVVGLINASAARVVSLDVPSGVGDGFREGHPAVKAFATLTMGLPKRCLYLPRARRLCGRIVVVPVGFPPALVRAPDIPGELLPLGGWKALLPPIPPDAHKNGRGHLAVFAGSPGTTGAARLCATAAARARLGLVTLFTAPDAWQATAQGLVSVMCRPWTPGRDGWEPDRFTGVLAGPGWGITDANAAWLDRLLGLPVGGVLDADALTLLARAGAGAARRDLGGRWVLTPHPGEFARLASLERDAVLDDPVAASLSLAKGMNAVIALKGHCTVVACPDGRYWILDAPNPAMATAGSGDVLAGIIAAAIAGGLRPAEAARFGVCLHACAGRLAVRRHGWFLAEDLPPLLSRMLWQ
jgi:ADP-dependent NAD(P)H-hydrate dehydratase / NAD(P)H-hydrate epimerase